jgi:rubrerythrin
MSDQVTEDILKSGSTNNDQTNEDNTNHTKVTIDDSHESNAQDANSDNVDSPTETESDNNGNVTDISPTETTEEQDIDTNQYPQYYANMPLDIWTCCNCDSVNTNANSPEQCPICDLFKCDNCTNS